MNDIRTFLKGQKETDAPALSGSAVDDVSQSELIMVENEIKKSTEVRKHYHKIVLNNEKRDWEICTTLWN